MKTEEKILKRVWVIKDTSTGEFFSMLGGAPTFYATLDFARTFETEQEAILCEEELIHPEAKFLNRDTYPVQYEYFERIETYISFREV